MKLLNLKNIIIISSFFFTTQPMMLQFIKRNPVIALLSGTSYTVFGSIVYKNINNKLNEINILQSNIKQDLDNHDQWVHGVTEGFGVGGWIVYGHTRQIVIEEITALENKKNSLRRKKYLFPLNYALEQLIKHKQN